MIERLWSGQVHDRGRYVGARLLRDDAGLTLEVGEPTAVVGSSQQFRLDVADARALWSALGEALQGGA